MKNMVKKSWGLLLVMFCIYLVGFQANDGLRNIGTLVLWFLGIALFIGAFTVPADKLLARSAIRDIVWLVPILLIAYIDMMFLSALYMVGRLLLIARFKSIVIK